MPDFNSYVPDWNNIPSTTVTGAVKLQETGSASVETSSGPLMISLHDFGARLHFGERQFGDYEMLLEEPKGSVLSIEYFESVENSGDYSLIEGGGYRLKLYHQPLSFELFKGTKLIQQSPSDSHFVRRFRLPPVARVDQGWFISMELQSGEPVYGLGEKWSGLDKRGQLVRSFNHDALGVNAEISYKNTPFALSLIHI